MSGNFDSLEWECKLWDQGWRWYRLTLHDVHDDKGVEAYYCIWQSSLDVAIVEAIKATLVYGVITFGELQLARGEAWNSTTPMIEGTVCVLVPPGREVITQERLL